MSSHYHRAQFLLSVAKIEQLPPDLGHEVAIVGHSNAGKSSVLNRLTQQKNLARVSKTPGRTQLLNLFELDEGRRLVDLPGYGFAKVPPVVKQKWERLIHHYVEQRASLRGLVVVMDIRHPLKPLDLQLLDYCAHRQLPLHILLNKADKLSKSAALQTIKQVSGALTAFQNSVTVQCFSAIKGTGLTDLYAQLNKWFHY